MRRRAGYHPSGKSGDEKNALKEQGFYHWPTWRRLRLLALQRDHYLCQACMRRKKITPATEVHHIQPITNRPELALCLDNLESLCWDCHEQTKPRGALKMPLGIRIIKP